MKITAFLTEHAIQFNLEPESDHERKFMSMLSDYTGEVKVHRGVNVAACMGGYLRSYGEDSGTVALTIKRGA